MADVLPLPTCGATSATAGTIPTSHSPTSDHPTSDHPTSIVLIDARGGERAMRVTWHHEADCVVLSIWAADRCVSTFRLVARQVPLLVQALVDGLGSYAATAESTSSPGAG